MSVKYTCANIVENYKICDGIYKMVIEDDSDVKAGQFYMLKPKTALLGRPISVSEVKEGKVIFVYAVVGQGTEEFAKLKSGETIDVIGPVGNGFEIKDYGKVALVGGGIGIAPLLQLSKNLRKRDSNVEMDLLVGFRDETYLVDEFKEYVDNTYIATNTGKVGTKGFVTDVLEIEKYDTVLCCGPEVMMKAVVDVCKAYNKKVYVSMEKHMACGVGACLVCTCKTKEGNKRTCKDGPVFDGYFVEL